MAAPSSTTESTAYATNHCTNSGSGRSSARDQSYHEQDPGVSCSDDVAMLGDVLAKGSVTRAADSCDGPLQGVC